MKKSMLVSLILLGFQSMPSFAAAAPQSRVAELKERIVSIARANQNQLDNFPEIRAELDPLVSELASLQDITAEESLARKVGTWRQLWTDDSDDTRANNMFMTVDREQTYQVVLNNGTFYNFSVINLPFDIKLSAFLKGSYQPQGDVLGLEFTSLKIRLGGVSNVTEAVAKAESNTLIGLVPFPGGAKKPNGPIGVKGEIKTVFIDKNLRLDYGQNLDDGIQDLFILVREAK